MLTLSKEEGEQIGGVTASTVICFTFLQPEKASSPIVVTLLGIVIEVREEQSEKTLSPIVVTLLGIVIEVRERQLAKAAPSIVVTLLGIVIEVREEQL